MKIPLTRALVVLHRWLGVALSLFVAAFSNTAVRAVEGLFDVDQWVVHQAFDEARPFFRVALDDPSGAEVYVSQHSRRPHDAG